MLYPQENEIRELKDLSGIWNFKVDWKDEGLEKEWYARRLENPLFMPVPSSYNEITVDNAVRDHIGTVYYEREFYIPESWKDMRLVIRVGSAAHRAVVYLNGAKITEHKGGFLPFEAEITGMTGRKNRLTISTDNTLDWTMLPPGETRRYDDPVYPEGFRTQEYHFDFFNYGGIHRPVKILGLPRTFIRDIRVTTSLKSSLGIIHYEVEYDGDPADVKMILCDAGGKVLAESTGASGELPVPKPVLWEPGKPYLYHVKAVLSRKGTDIDSYSLPVGIRTVRVTETEFLINDKPFYFKGFGKHEDMDIKGKGMDQALNLRDFNLIKWIGANSFRTSHYPYSEEIMNLADRLGIVIIDEVPAVGFNMFNKNEIIFKKGRVDEKTLQTHLETLRELIARDKNHPSVVMWSCANEAATHEEAAGPYFKAISEEARKLDATRPITIVQSSYFDECKAAQYFDVVCLNRYNAWYTDSGRLEVIGPMLEKELKGWHERFKQPVLLSEYGADTIAGFHREPAVMFTEEFQVEYLKMHHDVLDRLDFIIGEHIWNFADFATRQGVRRIDGNKKGLFTRQRQPKMAAHFVRERWKNKPDFRK
ncbi:MAG: beta-glucuronidase [Spirochaetales bacterium]|nr:beta-glucuronidase [Spirochaetales bacterium]